MRKLDRILNDAHALTELANKAMENISEQLASMDDPAVQSEFTIEELAREGDRLHKRIERLQQVLNAAAP